MGHFGRAAGRGSLLILFLSACLAAAHGQPQDDFRRPRTVSDRWERVYWDPGGPGFKSVFSAPVHRGKRSSPRWLWAGDDKGFLRLAAFDPESQGLLMPTRPTPPGAISYFGLSRLEIFAPLVRDREAPVVAIHFDERGDGYLLRGNKLYFTDNAGFNWRQHYEVANLNDETQATLFSIAVTGKGACMVGMFSTTEEVRESLIYCTDRPSQPNARWKRIAVKPQTQLFHIFFENDSRGWIVGTQGTILRTADGGDSWDAVDIEAESLLQSYFVNDKSGWIVGRYGTLLRTRTGGKEGKDWEQVKLPNAAQLANVSLRSIKFSGDGSLGWIVGDQGTILFSDDGGENWRPLTPPPPKDARLDAAAKDVRLEALFVDDTFCWAVGSGGAIWRQRHREHRPGE